MRKMIYGVLSVILPVVLLLGITVAYGPSQASASSPSFDPPMGRIVVLADDWTLGNYFDHGDADQFASNVFGWLTEHSAPSIKQKILVDEVYYNFDTSGHNLVPLLNYLGSLGYQCDVEAPEDWTPAMLAGYGAVLLERGRFTGSYPSTIVKDYILDGGGALVIGGASQENLIDQNKILNWFGLNVVTAVIVGGQQLTDFVAHPVTQDVSMLNTLNPTPITLVHTWPKLIPPQKPQILAQKLDYNWLAVWDGFVGIVAKPNAAFNTGLAIDGNELKGSLDAGYKFVTGGTDTLLDATLVNPTATPDLSNGMYPFCLNTNPAEKAKLMAYFTAKGWPQDYLDQIEAQVDGTEPFFYLEAVDGSYSLVDGFVYAITSETVKVTLRINDDYPAGLYTYRGALTNADGDFRVQVKLKVY